MKSVNSKDHSDFSCCLITLYRCESTNKFRLNVKKQFKRNTYVLHSQALENNKTFYFNLRCSNCYIFIASVFYSPVLNFKIAF